jgi:hypothetical protein
MSEFWKVTRGDSLSSLCNFLQSNMPESGWRVTYKPWKESRSLSMNAFQHVIYAEISTYLIGRGKANCSEEWVKDMLKNRFLGWVDQEFTDVVTGEKSTRQVLRQTSKLDQGEAGFYTEQIIEWAASIGCVIKIPAKCEYSEYHEAQIA